MNKIEVECPANQINLDTGSSMTSVHSRFVLAAAHVRTDQMRNTTNPTATVTTELDGLNQIKVVAVSDMLQDDALLGTDGPSGHIWSNHYTSVKERERIKQMMI